MAIYYVDFTGGSDSNDGLSTGAAWKTINKVNTSSFSGDDQILFKKGEIWRETLTVPSSGTSGHPIIFGVYGTGANPIISGADVQTGWTLVSGAAFESGFEAGDHTGWTSHDAGNVVDTESALVGTYGAHNDFAAGLANRESISGATTTCQVTGKFRINAENASDGNKTHIVLVRDSGGNGRGSIMVTQSGGNLYVDCVANPTSGSTASATFQITTGTTYTYTLEVFDNDTTGYAKLWIDGDLKKTTSNTNTGTLNLSRVEVGQVWGNNTILDIYHDDVKFFTGGEGSGYEDLYSRSESASIGTIVANGTPLDLVRWNTDLATTYASMTDGSYTYNWPSGWTAYIKSSTDPNTQTITVGIRDYAVNTNGKSDVTITGLDITGAMRHGVMSYAGNRISVTYCNIYNVGGKHENSVYLGNGVEISGNVNTYLVDHCTIYNIFDDGIDPQIYSNDVTITNVTISNNTFHHIGYAAVHTSIFQNSNAYISNNTITDNVMYSMGKGWSGNGNSGGYGISLYNYWGNGARISGTVITGNEIYDCLLHGINCFYADGVGTVTISQNNIHENDQCGIRDANEQAGASTTIVGNQNLIWGNGREGILIWHDNSTAGGLTLYNNTIVNNGDGTYANARFQEYPTTKLMKNNIFFSSVSIACLFDGTFEASADCDYNSYYRASGTMIGYNSGTYTAAQFADYKTASSQDANGIASDPLLVNPVSDLSLQSGSPCINAGVDVGLTTDYLGNPIVGVVDIGAYEYQPAVAGNPFLTRIFGGVVK